MSGRQLVRLLARGVCELAVGALNKMHFIAVVGSVEVVPVSVFVVALGSRLAFEWLSSWSTPACGG